MTCTDYTVRPESISDAAKIESLTETVFGPGMRARAAYFLREGVDHTMALSFVVESRDAVVGTVRLTPVVWGKTVVLMLGPLAVLQSLKGKGIGKLLMHTAVDAANVRAKGEGEPLIILVGDLDYYAPFGFQQISPTKITLPRPADPSRVLACELVPGALVSMQGAVSCYSGI